MTNPAPYPADTRARGWRFELDMERVRQSDTWALAPGSLRPWLLMLWSTSWEQTPCGSFPDDDELIAAKIDMPLEQFITNRRKLLRSWFKAEDGRLYHPVIVQRVNEMLDKRRKDAIRKGNQRAASSPPTPSGPGGVPRESHGTDNGIRRDSSTSTSTSTSNTNNKHATTPQDAARALPVDNSEQPQTGAKASQIAWQVVRMLDARGFGKFSQQHPDLLALIHGGATLEHFEDAAKRAGGKVSPFAWIVATVRGKLQDSASMALGLANGPPKAWNATRSGIEDMGQTLGLGRWDETAFQAGHGIAFPVYEARVTDAVSRTDPARRTA